jgi:hypothetical protein
MKCLIKNLSDKKYPVKNGAHKANGIAKFIILE